MANATFLTLGEAVSGEGLFSLYGVPIKDMGGNGFGRSVDPSMTHFAQIRAYSIGNFCLRLPRPVLMLVPGEGREPMDDPCARPGEHVWNVLHSDKSVALVSSTGTFGDLLDDISAKGIDGGLQLDNTRIQNGQACVDVHVWAKIEIFGSKVGFDERFPVCIPLQGCKTVWEIGWANLSVCFEAPNRICAKLCIGKWGLSKCWDICAALPLAAAEASSAKCGCET